MDYFAEIPPELILLLPPSLSSASLNALALTCPRLYEILQPELECRLTPHLGQKLLPWASESRPHLVSKLLSPPHSVKPCASTLRDLPPLHIAARVGNTEIATLLLDAGADPAAAWNIGGVQALHVAAQNGHRDMVQLLLDHGVPIDERFGSGAFSENALHSACAGGNLDVVKLLLQRGADSEYEGHYGGPFGFAVHHGQVDVVEFLLENGADPNATVPLFVFEPEEDKGELPPAPHTANLLYVAMDLPHLPSQNELRRRKASQLKLRRKTNASPGWKGLPLSANKKRLMALLMAYGARKDTTMAIISTHLASLAEEAQCAEHEYLATISKMLKDAEDAIPDFFRASVEAHFRLSTVQMTSMQSLGANFAAIISPYACRGPLRRTVTSPSSCLPPCKQC
ncbi:ankyrin repeat-containing domain protein [Mycena crocata]|nr:ankyrin repeat-containing domain protein [Mycena crocata]